MFLPAIPLLINEIEISPSQPGQWLYLPLILQLLHEAALDASRLPYHR